MLVEMLNAFVIVQIYKKGNRRQNSGWLMLDKVCSWSNYLFNFFWFIQPDFQVGCIWVQFHPTSGSSSMRWVQNICGGLCFKRFYWHLNVSNLWRATKSQKIKRPQTRQARRSKNSEYEKKNANAKKDWTDDEISLLIYMLEANSCLWNVYNTDYTNCRMKEIAYTEIATSLDTNIPLTKTKINSLRAQLGLKDAQKKSTKSGKSTDELYLRNWIHYDKLAFLVPVIRASKSTF